MDSTECIRQLEGILKNLEAGVPTESAPPAEMERLKMRIQIYGILLNYNVHSRK